MGLGVLRASSRTSLSSPRSRRRGLFATWVVVLWVVLAGVATAADVAPACDTSTANDGPASPWTALLSGAACGPQPEGRVAALADRWSDAVGDATARPVSFDDGVRDVIVLVPGYLGRPGNFAAAGVLGPLLASGWRDGGAVLATGWGATFTAEPLRAPRVVYQVGLPSDQGVAVQAQWLDMLVRAIAARHPQARVHLVGHSAGGIVARFLVVTRRLREVATVVTVASPNGGSELAELGRLIGESPLGWMTPLFGLPDFREGSALFRDLERSQPGTLLGWLNVQPHPDIRWVSIVRAADEWVAPWLQDLGRIAPLRGRVETLVSPAGHALTPNDGTLLAAIFAAR